MDAINPWITIRSLHRHDQKYIEALNKLLPQLSENLPPIMPDFFYDITEQKNFCVFVAEDHSREDGGKVLGTATIFFQHLLSGSVGEIHDVIVDDAFKKQGFGRLLTHHLFGVASWQAQTMNRPIKLSLTSRPVRKDANAMYLKYGFKLVAECVKLPNGSYDPEGTNLYRKDINP
jgi:ribosomal protein S18 acetylase RimI-like enzyme